jgi:hypothetical protein
MPDGNRSSNALAIAHLSHQRELELNTISLVGTRDDDNPFWTLLICG